MAAIYGGSAYGNSIGYAEQNGYSDSQAKAFATKNGINEGCKTLLFYGLLKGTGAASSAGYMSAGETAVASGVGSFGMEYIDQTVVTPEILKSTLGEDVDVDHKEAIKEAALDALITGAAAYVYSKSNAEPVSGEQNIYENAHALDKLDDIELLKAEASGGEQKTEVYCNEGEGGIVDVKLSRRKYPESTKHIEEAIKEGHPDTLTLDRAGASSRRKVSLKGVDTVPGLDRDEYPPAMSKEGGKGASIKLINPSDNRGSGSSISGQLRKYPNGTKYKIIIIDED